MELFQPPHVLWFEPLEERQTKQIGMDYCRAHPDLEPHEIDAADVYSVDEFSQQFETWVTTKSSKRIRVLMVWHAHFLSLACQQVLRRWMEIKSYRSRVWFHVELLNAVQQAIVSRCLVRRVTPSDHVIPVVRVYGDRTDFKDVWLKRMKECLRNQ